VSDPGESDTSKMERLERDLAQQRGVSRELESLVEDRTHKLISALEELEQVRARTVCQETATRLLVEVETLEEAAPELLRVFGEELRWPFASLWVPDAAGQTLSCAAVWSAPSLYATRFAAACGATRIELGRGVAGRAWADKVPTSVLDLSTDPGSGRVRAADEDGMVSAVAFPVVAGGAVRAVVELALPERRERSETLLAHLAVGGAPLGAALEPREARLVLHDLATASRMQSSVLPREISVERFDIAGRLRTADETGGDYYDVIPCPGGLWIGVGDVSGHGLDAGLIMLMIQSSVGALVRSSPDALPSELLAGTNALLYDNIRHRLRRDDFVTCTLLRLWSSGRVAMSGAHEEILIRRARGGVWQEITPPGIWLGLRAELRDAANDITDQLEAGDLLLLYTDGITEAKNPRGEQFGLDRMRAAVERVPDRTAQSICDAVFRTVDAFTASPIQVDDMCLVAVRYKG
jgi:serine phosphatase RsbU (regulator of sigma subunit)